MEIFPKPAQFGRSRRYMLVLLIISVLFTAAGCSEQPASDVAGGTVQRLVGEKDSIAAAATAAFGETLNVLYLEKAEFLNYFRDDKRIILQLLHTPPAVTLLAWKHRGKNEEEYDSTSNIIFRVSPTGGLDIKNVNVIPGDQKLPKPTLKDIAAEFRKDPSLTVIAFFPALQKNEGVSSQLRKDVYNIYYKINLFKSVKEIDEGAMAALLTNPSPPASARSTTRR